MVKVKNIEELQLLRTNSLDKEYDSVWAEVTNEVKLRELLQNSMLYEELYGPTIIFKEFYAD